MSSPPGTFGPPAASPPDVAEALLEGSADGLWVVDAAGLIQWCNTTAERWLGRSFAELSATRWCDALPATAAGSAGLRRMLDQLASPAPGQRPESVVVELTATNAGTVWLDISARPLTSATASQWLLVARDITRAQRSEQEARRLSELLDMAQEFGRIGVWERQIPSGAGTWDHHVFGFWGRDPALGAPGYEDARAQVHPDDREQTTYVDSTRQAGRYAQRYRVLHTDGSTRWIHSQWEVKVSPAGLPDRAIGIMMDDTDAYELARSLGDTSAQLELAIGLGNIALWRHDLRTDRVHYNDRAQDVMGLPPNTDGLSLQDMRAKVHPDDLPRLAAASRQALDNVEGPTDIEARFNRGDGGWRTVLTRRVLERGADGTPQAWVGIALDVSEQAEQRRRTTELTRRMETAASAAGVGVWSYDVLADEAQWNDEMFSLVGRPPALGAPNRREWDEQVLHAGDRDRIRREGELHGLRPDVVGEQQFRVTLAGGEIRWLENRVRRETLAGRPMIFGVTLDITDRRHAEEALRSAGERAALAAHGAGIGTWEMDLVGTGERWDAQMFHLRGLEPRPHPPSRAERLALLHPDDVPRVLDARADAAGAAVPEQYEFRVRLPDGSYRWLASRSSPLLDDSGRVQRRIGVNWDITEARQAEAAREASAAAQRENMAKSRFLSRVSHELRTPLNAVLGFTQLLQAEANLPPEQQARLGWIRSAGEHLLLLIDDVLDLSGLEAGDSKLELQPVALAELVRDALPLVESLALQHGITVRVGATDGVALADPTRLRQVLINLLSNGIKYNRPKGQVTVEVASVGAGLALRVLDSGRGLNADQLAHLFEPFNRLGAERDGIEGSGIGLVIVKALVERMGGTVQVSSQPGAGTCFSVELAATQVPPQPALAPLAEAPRRTTAAAQGRLLYIEDNPVNMLLVQELVASRTSIEMFCATTGEEGVRQALELQPTLVLVDMQLPDFDGFEVLRRLRADARGAGLRCVALSANALSEEVAAALAAGFADYWTKPIHFDRFLAALDWSFAAEPPAAGAGR